MLRDKKAALTLLGEPLPWTKSVMDRAKMSSVPEGVKEILFK